MPGTATVRRDPIEGLTRIVREVVIPMPRHARAFRIASTVGVAVTAIGVITPAVRVEAAHGPRDVRYPSFLSDLTGIGAAWTDWPVEDGRLVVAAAAVCAALVLVNMVFDHHGTRVLVSLGGLGVLWAFYHVDVPDQLLDTDTSIGSTNLMPGYFLVFLGGLASLLAPIAGIVLSFVGESYEPWD